MELTSLNEMISLRIKSEESVNGFHYEFKAETLADLQ